LRKASTATTANTPTTATTATTHTGTPLDLLDPPLDASAADMQRPLLAVWKPTTHVSHAEALRQVAQELLQAAHTRSSVSEHRCVTANEPRGQVLRHGWHSLVGAIKWLDGQVLHEVASRQVAQLGSQAKHDRSLSSVQDEA
jgi:hypothetical protein